MPSPLFGQFLFIGNKIMQTIEYSCDICNKVWKYSDSLYEGPLQIEIRLLKSGVVVYRRHILGDFKHICKECTTIFTKHIHEETLNGFTSNVLDYESIGPK